MPWHYWIAPVLLGLTVTAVAALAIGYLRVIVAPTFRTGEVGPVR